MSLYCNFHACNISVCKCPSNSDEALATLRKRLAGDPEEFPVLLTVFTNNGEWTVTVREDSIQYKPGGTLIAEGAKGSTQDDLYTFFGVIGYRTVISR